MSELEAHDTFAKKMAEKYPRYFGEGKRYGGFSIGEGWYHIIEALISQINHHTKWKRDRRASELRKLRAKAKGLDAMIKFCQGKSEFASDWDIDRAKEVMEDDIMVTPKVDWVRIDQIKEKFGGLRFYYQGGDEYISGLVSMAESWADRSCETCGDLGQRRSGGWIRTLCDKHEAEHQTRMKERNNV